MDSWAQFAFYKNEVTSTDRPGVKEKYDSHGLIVSAEAGYGFLLGNQDHGWLLTPQAQLIYAYLNTDSHDAQNGVQTLGGSNNNLSTRIGVRLHPAIQENSRYQPFIETNWLNHMFDRKMKFNQAGTGVLEIKDNTRAKNIIEAKLGLQANINKNLKIWGQLNGQWGQHGYNQYGTHAGVSYFW